MKDFSPQTWFVRIVTNMRSALHSSAGEISKNSTTLMWQKKGVGEHVQQPLLLFWTDRMFGSSLVSSLSSLPSSFMLSSLSRTLY